MRSVRRSIGAIMWFALVVSVAFSWVSYAQQTQNFVGKTDVLDAADISAGRRFFEAGARSNWHAHPNGQLILNEKGVGLHQIEGKPIVRLAPGDSVYAGPGVVHWHGAAPDAGLTQVNIGFGGTTKWGAPVSDAAYGGLAK